MKLKTALTTTIAAATLFAVWGVASAAPYKLVGWHQRSTSGALSSLFFKAGVAQGCPDSTSNLTTQPCYNYNQVGSVPVTGRSVSGYGIATTVDDGLATWDWNGTKLTGTGLLWASSFIGSSGASAANMVISDKVSNLSITPGTSTTTASSYECYEGSFLYTVGANGCLNVDTNFTNPVTDSTAVYNVGGDASCIQRTVGGDDTSTGNVRGLRNSAGGGGCDATDGGFAQYVVVANPRFLILANQANIVGADGCYMFGRANTAASSPCAADATISGASYLIFAPDVDTDGDGVVDALDNCRLVSNANQADSDADGIGNRCDGDMNNNNTTNAQDYVLFRQQLGQPSAAPTYNKADINANGVVNAQDYVLFRGLLGAPPGPSGLCNGILPCPVNP